MLSFIDFLSEMVWYTKTPKEHPDGSKRKAAYIPDHGVPKGSIHYSTMASGHKIFKHVADDHEDRTTYHVRNPEGNKTHLTITGFHKQGKFMVHTTTKWNDAPEHFASQVYHHLVVNHHPILSGSAQNTGSKNLWNRLAKHKDIEVHGYDMMAQMEIPHKNVYAPFSGFGTLTQRYKGDYLRLLARKK